MRRTYTQGQYVSTLNKLLNFVIKNTNKIKKGKFHSLKLKVSGRQEVNQERDGGTMQSWHANLLAGLSQFFY